MRLIHTISAFAPLLLVGCAAVNAQVEGLKKKHEEKGAYQHSLLEHDAKAIAPAMETPLSLHFTKDEAPEAWARAQVFAAKWASTKIQIATDVRVENETPTYDSHAASADDRFGYAITKVPVADGFQIDVACTAGTHDGRTIGENHAAENAHHAAYFIKTGQLLEDGKDIWQR